MAGKKKKEEVVPTATTVQPEPKKKIDTRETPEEILKTVQAKVPVLRHKDFVLYQDEKGYRIFRESTGVPLSAYFENYTDAENFWNNLRRF